MSNRGCPRRARATPDGGQRMAAAKRFRSVISAESLRRRSRCYSQTRRMTSASNAIQAQNRASPVKRFRHVGAIGWETLTKTRRKAPGFIHIRPRRRVATLVLARSVSNQTAMQITYRYRVKDKRTGRLKARSAAVNFVWNYCNEVQTRAVNEAVDGSAGNDLDRLIRGVTREGLDLLAGPIAVAECRSRL
jgi:hypothetical protein